MDFSITNVLALVSLGMLVIVTSGILYLTASEWRDRRRRDRDQRTTKKKRS